MDFPDHTPAIVRTYIEFLVEGEDGWQTFLRSAEDKLAAVRDLIQGGAGGISALESLRAHEREAAAHRDALAETVGILRRLASDSRMREAFESLAKAALDDQQWQRFIRAAWVAHQNYTARRERLKRAAELRSEIADTAEKLAALIDKLSSIGITCPDELHSIPALLQQTDNHEMDGRNLRMWRGLRRHILGDLPEADAPTRAASGQPNAPVSVVRVVLAPGGRGSVISRENEKRETLRYAWETAPGFPELLRTAARGARNFEPKESDVVEAALVSQKSNPKTQYLRAFARILTGDNFSLSGPIIAAMAVTANVVLDSPEIDVTRDDVRKIVPRARQPE